MGYCPANYRPSIISAFIDPVAKTLIVNSASDKAADEFTAYLREALGSLPVCPAVGYCHTDLTAMYRNEAPRPEGCSIGEELSLTLKQDPTVKAKFKNLAINSSEIVQSLNNGMSVVSVSMNIDESIDFIVDEGLTFKRLKYADKLVEQAHDSEDERADTIIMLGAVKALMKAFSIDGSSVTESE